MIELICAALMVLFCSACGVIGVWVMDKLEQGPDPEPVMIVFVNKADLDKMES